MAIDLIEDVDCPECHHGGPHSRTGVAWDGSHIVVRCGDRKCQLEWNVTGPTKWVDQ